MPTCDIVSKLDLGEIKNAINMANKQIGGRYDFKGSTTKVELKDDVIELFADDDYKIKAALDILRTSMAKRSIGMKSLEVGDVEPSGNQNLRQTIKLRFGIDKEQGKIINKIVKGSGLKVSSAYLDEKIRLTSKSIDSIREAVEIIRGDGDVKVDIQMENMKR